MAAASTTCMPAGVSVDLSKSKKTMNTCFAAGAGAAIGAGAGAAAGVAGAGGGFAYVSYPMVETLTKTAGTSESQVLGVAIAHEIGHLLLGAAHSQTGIMCVRWRRPHFELMRTGRLLFTPEQAIQIKAEVMRRIAQSSASNER